jgi:hypothetical protein
MTDSQEAPPRHLPAVLKPFVFDNPEKARAAGKRSGESRRAKAAERANKDKPPSFNTVQVAANAQLELVGEQIARTRLVLNDERTGYCPCCERSGIEPHHRAQLLKALDTLLDRQRKLLGIRDPGPDKGGGRVRGNGEVVWPVLDQVAPTRALPEPALPTAEDLLGSPETQFPEGGCP